jgi:hypothetical protein
MGLITYATIVVYQAAAEASMSLATIYGSTTGILTIVTGYIQKRMSDFLNAEKPTRSAKRLEREDAFDVQKWGIGHRD